MIDPSNGNQYRGGPETTEPVAPAGTLSKREYGFSSRGFGGSKTIRTLNNQLTLVAIVVAIATGFTKEVPVCIVGAAFGVARGGFRSGSSKGGLSHASSPAAMDLICLYFR